MGGSARNRHGFGGPASRISVRAIVEGKSTRTPSLRRGCFAARVQPADEAVKSLAAAVLTHHLVGEPQVLHEWYWSKGSGIGASGARVRFSALNLNGRVRHG